MKLFCIRNKLLIKLVPEDSIRAVLSGVLSLNLNSLAFKHYVR